MRMPRRSGLSDRQIRIRVGSSRFIELHSGVYRIAGAPDTKKAASLPR